MAGNYTAHVVSHTHGDREWYKPFQHYRMRLVDLTDALLGLMESNPEFKYWTFDGQSVVIEALRGEKPRLGGGGKSWAGAFLQRWVRRWPDGGEYRRIGMRSGIIT